MKKIGEEEIKETLEPVGRNLGKMSHTVGEAAKETAAKAEAAIAAGGVKAAEVKDKVVSAAAKTGRKAASAKKRAGSLLPGTGRKASRKKAPAGIGPEFYVQWAGRECGCSDVLERAKADFRAGNQAEIRSCKIYIKPEDGMAYYVINGTEGKFRL